VSEIEERLNALEKRARADDERWQTLDGQSKASRIILVAIGAPICAANPELLHPIIKNLSLDHGPPGRLGGWFVWARAGLRRIGFPLDSFLP
jgi:hypothetical protein